MIELLVDDFLTRALHEDLGRSGDITTDAIVPADATGRALAVARATGVDLISSGAITQSARILYIGLDIATAAAERA
jgi:nicotinate-nucleotide pyrophosphorylase